MTTSLIEVPQWPKLVGRQEAEYHLCDDGDQSWSDKAVMLATRVKKPQMPWQEATLRGLLTLDPDGMFTHPTGVIIAPRQNGKTLSAAELRILCGLFQRSERIVYSAQRWNTAQMIYLRLKRLINSRPSLKRRVTRQTCSQGVASIEVLLDDGSEAVAMFITRSPEFRGPDEIDLVIYDEAYNLTDAEMSAISPTQLAARNPQTIYLSSAVNREIHANGQMLANIRHRALEAIRRGDGAHGLYYREHCAPEPKDVSVAERRRLREDPATWRLGNPSYGVIQTEAKVRKLLTEMSAKAFEVEVLGWGDWPAVADSEDRPLKPKWPGLADADPALVGPWAQVIGIDRCPTTKFWSISGAQRRVDGHSHMEIGYHDKASPTEVVEFVIQFTTGADPMAIVIPQRSPAAILKPYLVEAGIEPIMANGTEMALACEGILESALADQISHSDQRVLNESIDSAIKDEMSDKRWVWTSVVGGSVGPVNAMTLAHWGLLNFGRMPKQSPPPMAAARETSNVVESTTDFDPMTAAF